MDDDDERKMRIIREVYYSEHGFGSNAKTLADAQDKDPTITMKDIIKWKSLNLERLKHMKGYNSYVAPEAHYEYQVDLFNFKNKNPKAKEDSPYGVLAIDSFTKYCWIYPIDNKDVPNWVMALGFIFEKMGKPQVLYTDPDASMQGKLMTAFLKRENIRWIQTREHAPIAERVIRTIKFALNERLKKQPLAKWTDLLPSVLETYNKSPHGTIGMTPEDATHQHNEFEVKTNLLLHKIHKRKYPDLSVGDRVKIYKKKEQFDKEGKSVWDPQVRTIQDIQDVRGQPLYKVSGVNHLVIRSNLLKVG